MVKRNSTFVKIMNYHFHKIDDSEFTVFISHIIVHPKFQDGDVITVYDFALLRLEYSINSGKFDILSTLLEIHH